MAIPQKNSSIAIKHGNSCSIWRCNDHYDSRSNGSSFFRNQKIEPLERPLFRIIKGGVMIRFNNVPLQKNSIHEDF